MDCVFVGSARNATFSEAACCICRVQPVRARPLPGFSALKPMTSTGQHDVSGAKTCDLSNSDKFVNEFLISQPLMSDTRIVPPRSFRQKTFAPGLVLVVGLVFTLFGLGWSLRSVSDANAGAVVSTEGHFRGVVADYDRRVFQAEREIELVMLGATAVRTGGSTASSDLSLQLDRLGASDLQGIEGFILLAADGTTVSVPVDGVDHESSATKAMTFEWDEEAVSQIVDSQHRFGYLPGTTWVATSQQGQRILVGVESFDGLVLLAAFRADGFLLGADHSDHQIFSLLTPTAQTADRYGLASSEAAMDDVEDPHLHGGGVTHSHSGEADFSATHTIDVFGDEWLLTVYTQDAFLEENSGAQAVVVGLAGLSLTLACTCLVTWLNRSRSRIDLERVAAEDELRLKSERFQVGFETSPIGVVELDPDGRVVTYNRAFGDLLQISVVDDLVAKPFDDVVGFIRRGGDRAKDTTSFGGGGLQTGRSEVCYQLQNGSSVWVQQSVSAFGGPNGLDHVLVQVVDVTEERKSREELQRRVLHDGLTRLPNRTLLGDRIVQALIRSRRTSSTIAVIFIDIDHFKTVNDSLGHSTGDLLLCEVADRLRSNARDADTIARFGGDEFVMLCEELGSPEDASGLAERLRRTMEAPIDVGDRSIPITLSMGIAVANSADNPEALLRDADLAMYQAKEQGRDRVVMFQREMRDSLVDRLALEDQLRRSIVRGDLRLHYQPILDLQANSIAGYESLVRWLHPTRGLLAPGEFLEIAEQLDLLTAIDAWTLETAAQQLADWIKAGAVDSDCAIGVNASAQNFVNASYPTLVSETLDRTGLPAERLIIELTEDAVLANTDRAAKIIAELRAIGVRVAIDDFGTGYSSFSQLASLDFDILKVDRSFTRQMHEKSGGEIVGALIQMAQALGLQTIVEGVETDADLALLREFGSDQAQGYVIARPAPADEALLHAASFVNTV